MNAAEQTLEFIQQQFLVDLAARTPIEIPLSRHGPLPRLWEALGFKVGAEIGVEQGKYSKELCENMPGLQKLYSIDSWKAYTRYRDHVSQDKLDAFYEQATRRLAPYPVEVMRSTSVDAARTFKDNTLDFVYIDANHAFDFVVVDIIEWAPKVRPGGIVAGHDYRSEGKEKPPLPFGVIQAINAYTDAHKIKPWFVLRGDPSCSWMFVRSEAG